MEQNSINKTKETKAKRFPNHMHKKRPIPKPSRPLESEIYITTKTNFKAQQKKCEDLLNSGISEIFIHCCGNAITRGINLALHLVNNSHNALEYAINTSTIQLIDEHHPLCDDEDITFQKRNNSAIHIKITRTTNFLVDVN